MAIRPIDEYSGKVATPTAEYPDGKAQNITSPGDGTGTPWEAKLINDIFGFQQYLTTLAGITPSGTPDNASTSQYFQAIWKLLNVRPLTYNIVSDVDLTLTAAQNLYTKITITDTGVVLTTGRNVIVDNVGRILIFTNSTAQTLTVKTAAGTGVAVTAGASSVLVNDGTDVLDFSSFVGAAGGVEVGTVSISPVSTVPTGFLECDGSGLDTTTYADLFAVIGYTYGGSGATFNIPDLRGEFIRGFDNGRGVDSGRIIGTAQLDEFKSHHHIPTGQLGYVNAYGRGLNSGYGFGGGYGNSSPYDGGLISTEGGTETRPRNIAMMYCIKY